MTTRFTRLESVESPRLAAQRSTFELAYLGDALYELWCRRNVLTFRQRAAEVNTEVFRWVRCQTQAAVVRALLPHFTPQELDLYQRGKNNKPKTRPKHATVQDYREATGFECVVGYWYLTDMQRFETLMESDDVCTILIAECNQESPN